MLIKRPDKFEDIPTFLTTRTGGDIEFQGNLQFGGALNGVPGANDVRLSQIRRHSLLSQTFPTTLA